MGIPEKDILLKEAIGLAANVDAGKATQADKDRLLVLLASFLFNLP